MLHEIDWHALAKTIVIHLTTGLAGNAVGLVLCVLYALAVIALALFLRRFTKMSPWLIRHLLHAVIGGWVLVAFYWIDLWPASWFAPLAFMYLNHLARKHPWARSLREDDADAPPLLGIMGPALILVLLFWWPGYQFIVISGIAVQTVARQTGAVVGRYWGRRRFSDRGLRDRTFESFAGMVAASILLLFGTIYIFAQIPGVWFGPWAFFGALLAAAVAAVAQLYTPSPYDRWTTPLLTAITVYYYAGAGFHF